MSLQPSASASASDQPQPVTLFEVYADTNCTGPLFTLDTTWQRFTSLHMSQMAFLSSLSNPNNTNSTVPCLTNWTSNAGSSMFQCIDIGVYVGTGYSGAQAIGWTSPGCFRNDGTTRQVYRYLTIGAANSNSTLGSGGCQLGVVSCPTCGAGVYVGMRISCAVPSAPSIGGAATSLSSSSSSTLVVALQVALVAHLLACT